MGGVGLLTCCPGNRCNTLNDLPKLPDKFWNILESWNMLVQGWSSSTCLAQVHDWSSSTSNLNFNWLWEILILTWMGSPVTQNCNVVYINGQMKPGVHFRTLNIGKINR